MIDKDLLRSDRAALEQALTEAGATVRGNSVLCPFHDDKHPSGSIYQHEGVWRFKCMACDAGGDVFDVRALANGTAPADELKKLAGPAQPTKKKAFASLDAVKQFLSDKIGPIVSEYVFTDVAGEYVETEFRLKVPEGKKIRPCHLEDAGYIIGAPEKRYLYNLPALASAETVIVVEGPRKADVLEQYGFVATSSPGGSENAGCVDWSALAGKNVVIWPDYDAPGRRYCSDVKSYLEPLSPSPTISIIDPAQLDLKKKEDVVDFIEQLQAIGKTDAEITEAISSALSTAKSAGLISEYQERLRRIVTGELACLPLPWPNLAHLARIGSPGWLVIIAGRQGAAKTFFEIELLRYWLSLGISASAYWLEGDRGDLMDRTLAQVSSNADVTDLDWQKENSDTMMGLTEQNKDELDCISKAVTVSAGLGLETLEDLASWIESQAKAGRRAIFVDPVSAATRKDKPWVSDPAFIREVKRTARDYECTVLLITHLIKGADDGTPDKVAGSAAYGRFSDCVLQITRHDPKSSLVRMATGRTEIKHNQTLYIEKTRAPGTGLRLAYDLTKGLTFTEYGVVLRKGNNNE